MLSKDNLNLEQVFSSKGRAKILDIFVFENELNISEIIKRTSLNHSCVLQHLEFFKSIDFIQEKKFGRIRIFRFKNENINGRALRKLVQLWKNE